MGRRWLWWLKFGRKEKIVLLQSARQSFLAMTKGRRKSVRISLLESQIETEIASFLAMTKGKEKRDKYRSACCYDKSVSLRACEAV
jgi:hypothetical protein